MAEEVASRNLILIALQGCEPCKELQKEVQTGGISTILKNEYGVDVSKMRVLYGDKEGPDGDQARNICYSIDKFAAPMLVIEETTQDGRKQYCLLSEKLEKQNCAIYKELPM